MSPSLRLPIIIRRKLDRLGRSLRFYAALDGVAALFLTVILLFLLNFALDRFFEFPLVVRVPLLPVLTGTILYVLWKRIIRRSFAAIRRDQLATLLEHYVPKLNEALVTTVEMTAAEMNTIEMAAAERKRTDGRQQTAAEKSDSDADSDTDFERQLMQQTIDEAAVLLRGVNVHRFFRVGRVFSRFMFALLCVVLTAGACAYHSETFSLWFSRNILLSEQEYPRRSQLLVDGFQDGKVRIGRGDSFTLSIRAGEDMPLVPETIRVRVGTPEAGYRTLLLDQFRRETREGSRWRIFSTTFPEMLETVNLHIRGADSTLSGLFIEVVPTPTLTEMVLTQHFPSYMQRPDRPLTLSGRTTIPDGTAITITAKSTKPLINATAIINGEEIPAVTSSRPPGGYADRHPASAPDRFSDRMLLTGSQPTFTLTEDSMTLTLPPLREETVIDFRLTDVDKLTNRHPVRAELGIIRDRQPVVTARLEGIGPAITPEAVLPIVGEITDDNGLALAMIHYTTEPAADNEETETQREPTEGTTPITGITSGQTIFPLSQSFAVSPIGVLPGDKLVLYVEASDAFDLDTPEEQYHTGQTGTGTRWQLEIVTPEQLKTLLETREITLRQRFEIVISEVERTKGIMFDYSLEPPEQQIQQAEALTLEEGDEDETAENPEAENNRAQRQRELDAQKQKILDTINLEQSDLGKFHISRMFRDTHKEVYDLTNIVESFRVIRTEMINNRIFTEDERRRIDQDIMQPIQELINRDFPGIDELLTGLEQILSERDVPNRPLAMEERRKILAQFDATLLKMATIRDKMASMESFNEALEILRSIIRQQQILRNETLEEQRQRLRNLLN